MFFLIDSQTGAQADPNPYPSHYAAVNALPYVEQITMRPCHVKEAKSLRSVK